MTKSTNGGSTDQNWGSGRPKIQKKTWKIKTRELRKKNVEHACFRNLKDHLKWNVSCKSYYSNLGLLGIRSSTPAVWARPSALAASKRAPMQGGPAKFPKDPWRSKEFNVFNVSGCVQCVQWILWMSPIFTAQTEAPMSFCTFSDPWAFRLKLLPCLLKIASGHKLQWFNSVLLCQDS